jgi:hypothetical protein
MAKQIIVLEFIETSRQFRVAFWLPVPTARQPFYANPSATSQWTGASAAEKASLVAGEVYEVVESLAVPDGATLAEMQAIVENRWTALSNDFAAKNPWLRYGSYYDSGAWTAGGVS